MKIEKNYNNLMEAWEITTSALHTIKHMLLDNAPNVEEATDALYKIIKRNNEWYDEIEKMPF